MPSSTNLPGTKKRPAASNLACKTTKKAKTTFKPKATAKRVRGPRGILQVLVDAPLDILFEAFSYLEPVDIMRLSRTSKDLRTLLMTRSSAFVWRQARANVDIPGLPEPLPSTSEPEYANLIPNDVCHHCNSPRKYEIIWSCRIRCCKKCSSRVFCSADSFMQDAWSLVEPLVPTDCTAKFKTSYYIPVADKYLATVERLVRRGDQDRVDRWLRKEKQKLKVKRQWTMQCLRWTSVRSQRLEVFQRYLRIRRNLEIAHRLSNLGWDKEIAFDRRSLRLHHLVYQPKELTERVWTNIEPRLVEFMKETRKRRLKQEAEEMLKRLPRKTSISCSTKSRWTWLLPTRPFQKVLSIGSIAGRARYSNSRPIIFRTSMRYLLLAFLTTLFTISALDIIQGLPGSRDPGR
ncbi:hypothetical protein C8J56DRAFT_945546 [Mycena floridula]|nr:hypothetical protein C8J56DRAFT_945546 [Mycena floridula]